MPKAEYLEIGQIVGTHGVRGELRVDPWCDSPEVLATVKTLYADAMGNGKLSVKARPHKRIALMKISGVDTVEDAERLRGQVLYVKRGDLKLDDGAHFICDLIGMQVIDADSGEKYGEITDVSSTGSNDVYHMCAADGREILIPAIPAIIASIDVDSDTMRIVPMKGLFDDEI